MVDGGSGSFKAGPGPGSFFALGEEYLIAAKALSQYQSPPTPFSLLGRVHVGLPTAKPPDWLKVQMPLFYCIAHSAELFVKSYLTARGKAPPKTRTKNHPDQSIFDAWRTHDLAGLLMTATSIDLQLSDNAKAVILDIAESNVEYELRFQDSGIPVELPPLKASISAVEELGRTVSVAISRP